jgi:DNA-binding beta-propeller fold protein YncE
VHPLSRPRLALALALVLLGSGCPRDDDDDTAAPPDSAWPLLFVSMFDGPIQLVDAVTLEELGEIGGGHTQTLGCAPSPDQRSVYYGNRDVSSLQRLDRDEATETWTVAATAPIPGSIKGVEGARGGSVVAVTTEGLDDVFDERVFFVHTDDDATAVGPYVVEVAPAQLDGEGDLLRPCACTRIAAALSPDGGLAFVTHSHEHVLDVVDPATAERIERIALEPAAGSPDPWLGPSGFPAVSHGGDLLAVPGLEAQRLYLFDVQDRSVVRLLETPGELPISAAWSPDDDRLFVATIDAVPLLGQESINMQIPSRVHEVDVDSLEITATVSEQVLTVHVAIAPDGRELLLGGSFSSVARYDLQTLQRLDSEEFASFAAVAMGLDF